MHHRKLRGLVRKSENSEERIKIHQWLKKQKLVPWMKLSLSYQSGKKMESREDKGSVKFGNLTAMFTEILLLSPITKIRRTYWNPLEYYPCTVAPPPFFCLLSSPSHSSVRILFRLCHFTGPSSRKTELRKKLPLRFERIAKHKRFWRFACRFNHESNGSKRSKR